MRPAGCRGSTRRDEFLDSWITEGDTLCAEWLPTETEMCLWSAAARFEIRGATGKLLKKFKGNDYLTMSPGCRGWAAGVCVLWPR
jgi:hypothetical protein